MTLAKKFQPLLFALASPRDAMLYAPLRARVAALLTKSIILYFSLVFVGRLHHPDTYGLAAPGQSFQAISP